MTLKGKNMFGNLVTLLLKMLQNVSSLNKTAQSTHAHCHWTTQFHGAAVLCATHAQGGRVAEDHD